MFLYEITFDEILFKAVLYYGIKFSELKEKVTIISKRIENQSNDSLNVDNLVYKLPYGLSKICFNDEVIEIKVVKCEPIISDGLISYYNNMTLECENKDKLEKFLLESKMYFNTEVLNKKKEKKKVCVYMYDGFWDILHKSYKRKLDTLYFDDDFKEKITNKIETFINPEREKLYQEFGIPYKLNILLEGYPGTGKTSLIYAIASKFNLNIAIINFDLEMSDAIFMRALRKLPEDTVLILEDIDVLFRERKEHDNGKSILSFSGLLNALDGIASAHKQIIFMTTNYVCNLDKALIRPGRIDESYHFGYCKKNQMKRMFDNFFPDKTEDFSKFYDIIKNNKLTTAMLQKYFFTNLDNYKIFENIDELIQCSKQNNYSDLNMNLYM